MELNTEQIEFLDKFAKGKWTLNEKTGLVDIDGSFVCSCKNLSDFKGVRFGVVGWDFDCCHNNLTSLEGAPQEVGGDFICHNNKLTSLVGAPRKVRKRFYCYRNKLTSLAGVPQKVTDFNCSSNELTSLEGAPKKVGGRFTCSNNPISEKTLNLVWNTMVDKKIDYWTALCILKSEISKSDFEKLEVELDKRLDKDTQKGISMMGRFGNFD